MKKIILLIPPTYDRDAPPLGTPTLAGFLKSKRIQVRQMDLNVLYFDYIKDRIEDLFSEKYRDEKIKKKVYYHRILHYQKSRGGVAYAFENNPGSSFSFTEKILSSRFLFQYLADEEENPFVCFFMKEVLPSLRKGSYEAVGFSVTAPSQVIATFTFCHMLKRELPEIKIVLGGQWTSLYRQALRKRRSFSKLFDFMICFEGETPLFCLLRSLAKNQPLSEVPNLFYQEGGKWKKSRRSSQEDMDRLPPPDFTGLPLTSYLNTQHGLNLTIETSRGCYWNKCIYCVDLPKPKPQYREKSTCLVIRDMKTLIKRYGVKHLQISNATFSPRQMRDVSRNILSEGIRISWWTMARFDSAFDRETLKLAKEAGCVMIGFGLESINQRVLNFIEKGIHRDIIERIITDAHELHLPIYFQTMIGLPSETMEEALDTIEFVTTFKGAEGRWAAFNACYLTPGNDVFMHRREYGIEILPGERLPFRYFYPFRHLTRGIDQTMAAKLIRLYTSIKEKKSSSGGGPQERVL